jgi:hypothetical protein
MREALLKGVEARCIATGGAFWFLVAAWLEGGLRAAWYARCAVRVEQQRAVRALHWRRKAAATERTIATSE